MMSSTVLLQFFFLMTLSRSKLFFDDSLEIETFFDDSLEIETFFDDSRDRNFFFDDSLEIETFPTSYYASLLISVQHFCTSA